MNVNTRPDSEFVLAPWSKPTAIERAMALTQQIERGEVTLEIIVQRSVLQALFEGEFLQKQALSEVMIDYIGALSRHHGIPSDLADVVRIHDACMTQFRDLLTENITAKTHVPQQKQTILMLNSGVIGAVYARLKQIPEDSAAATEREWVELCVLTMLGTQSRLTIKPMEQQLLTFILAKRGMTKIKTDTHIAMLISTWKALKWITCEDLLVTPVTSDDIDDYL